MFSHKASAIDLSPKAIEQWRQNIRVSTFANYCLEMGIALEREGSIANALSSYSRAVDLQPHRLEGQVRLIRLLQAVGQDSTVAEQAALRVSPNYFALGLVVIAIRQLKDGDCDGALRLASEAMQAGSDLPWVQSVMTIALSFSGRIEEARRLASKIRPSPSDIPDNFSDHIAEVLHNLIVQQQWSCALPCLEALASVDPDNMTMMDQLAWAYLVAGEWPAAEKALRHHLAHHPDDSARTIDLAQVLHAQGDLVESKTHYQREAARSNSPYQLRGRVGLGLISIAEGQPEKAVELLKMPLGDAESDWCQKDPMAASTMSLALLQIGDMGNAEQWMNAALHLAEDNHWVLSSMAVLRLRQGNRKEAVELLQKTGLTPQLSRFTACLRPWAFAELASAYEEGGIRFLS
ncbi:tetratricopeptide repeat protein [Azospirillum sp. TSH64]|uniref:tetratricopeptide repeat protein n=1 Tax=Azospirillum sp. TSH64 TaxID=652740 RepID=UPI000D644ACB|nr:tetratricopeptide repeat protein [Azospirillum sp. TSH64]